jgi:hypothetical protein
MGVVDAAVAGHKKILQKPQQIRVSSPSTHQNRLNQQKTNEKKPSRKWHSSYARRHIIKAVVNKQTRPISRAFAFNAQQAVMNQRVIGMSNRMTTLQTQPAEAHFPPITLMFRRL